MNQIEFENRYTAARRDVIQSEFSHLNKMQIEATLTTQGPLLLLAGAGSGKTTVIINRIANLLRFGSASDSEQVPQSATPEDLELLEQYVQLLQNDNNSKESKNSNNGNSIDISDDNSQRVYDLCALDPVEPWRIIAITFTNKAAGEMKERLARLPGLDSEDIWAMTFHSACSRILRRDIDRLGYERSFTIYDTADTVSLMKRILKDMNIDDKELPHKLVLNYVSRKKNRMVTPDEYLAEAEKENDYRRIQIGRAYREYEFRMKASNALDFDDLILLAVRLFLENPDILQHYQRRFKYVLVDEYQDTNSLQYLFAAALAGGHGNICVVGDDDQSIYKFRGATIENILNFEKQFKDASVIRLEQNYRSTGYILEAANDVISNNVGRMGKKLWTDKEAGSKPELHLVDDERVEAQFVADRIIKSRADNLKWADHTVLYRMNAQSNQLETAFKRSGIPYQVIGGTGFYERAEIKDMLAYLCVISNPQDDVRLLRIINKPARGIGDTTIERLVAFAAYNGCSVFDAIEMSQTDNSLKSAYTRLHAFFDLINALRDVAKNNPLDVLYDELIARTGYIRALEEKDSYENTSRIENVRELKTNILSFIKEHEDDGSLFEFLSETALYTDFDRDNSSTDRVNLMTMHSAKGLEFDTVFVVGFEEGVFPGMRSISDPAEIEEERRLCYVAMTRAMRKLYMICASQRTLFGKTSVSHASRFAAEIKKENVIFRDTSVSYDGFFDSDDAESMLSSDAGETKTSSWGRNGSTYSRKRNARYGSSPNRAHSSGGKTEIASSQLTSAYTGNSVAVSDFRKGDVVVHSVFGRGLITLLSPAGGDALLEIAFDDVGTKRFMLNTAIKYLIKP